MIMADEKNTLVLTLDSGGDVVIRLRPDLAPQHVERIRELAEEEFYDGVVFHRVIDGFMAQGGDPTGTGMGGSDKPDLPAEFSREPHVRGVCSMARSQSPNSANSQFRSEEHTSELQSLMRISYAVFCLKNKNQITQNKHDQTTTQSINN